MGPYLFVPLVGPTDVRDLIGEGADTFLNPLFYMRFPGHMTLEITTPIVAGLDTRYRAEGQLQAILADAADPYATLRSVYLQNRESLVRGENAAQELPPMEDIPSAPDQSAPSTAAPDQSAPPTGSTPDQSQTAPNAPDQTAPPPSDQTAPAPGPSAAAHAATRTFADASDDPDAPIATARACDLEGSPAAHGA
jgi:phospholipid-binding lipoprotein MlaA